MSESRGVAVYRAGNQIEGNFVKGLLTERGIPVTAHPENARKDAEVELQVPEPHAALAQSIIRAYEQQSESASAAEEDWVCHRCGEANESSFEECWNCQAAPGNA